MIFRLVNPSVIFRHMFTHTLYNSISPSIKKERCLCVCTIIKPSVALQRVPRNYTKAFHKSDNNNDNNNNPIKNESQLR